MMLKEAVDEFMINRRVKGCSAHTIKNYTRALKRFVNYVGDKMELESIKVKDLNSYYLSFSETMLISTTVQNYIRALRAFLNWCYEENYTSARLTDRFRLPKAKRNIIDVLTESEIHQVINTFDISDKSDCRNYCIVALMLDCGLRLNEITKIQLDNIHLKENYMIIDGKGNKQRIIPFGSLASEALQKYLSVRPSARGSLFINIQNENPMDQNGIRHLTLKLRKQTGIRRLKPHLLRHTFATMYLENGGNIYTLQAILGHTSLEMVKRYLHISKNNLVRNFSQYSPLDKLF